MMTNKKPTSRGLAIVLILCFQALAFGGIWAVIATNGHRGASGLSRWFMEGGPWMYLVVLLFLLEGAVALLLGILQVGRRIPLPLYLLVPLLALVVGVFGRLLGTEQAFEAIAMAAPDQKGMMWSMSLAIADIPRSFALFVVSAGGLFLLTASSVAAFVRRSPGKHLAFGGIAGGVTAVAALACVILGLVEGQTSGTGLRPVTFGVLLLFAVPLLVLATPGLKHLADSESEDERGEGFSLALGMGFGLLLAVLGLAAAFQSGDRTMVLSSLGSAAPDQKVALLSAAMAVSRGTSLLGLIAVMAALFAAAPPIIFAGPGAPHWASRHPLQLVLLVMMVGLGVGIDRLGDFSEAGKHEVVREALKSPLPPELVLPRSATALAYDGKPILLLREGKLGSLDPSRFVLPIGGGGGDRTLALPADLSGADLQQVMDQLFAEDISALQLLAVLREHGAPPAPEHVTERQARLASMGLAGELLQLTTPHFDGLKLMLARDPAQLWPFDEPRLGLILEVDRGTVTPSTTKERLPPIPALPDGSVDREALSARLQALKDAYPDETSVAIHPGENCTLQQVVDALEAANSVSESSWNRELLFPEGALVSSAARPEPPPPPSTPPSPDDGGILGVLGRGPPNSNSAGDGYGSHLEKPPPAEPAEAAQVMGSLSRAVIARVVQAHQGQIKYCYERELIRRPKLSGKLKVKFTISATGNVTMAKIAGSTLNDPSVESCLVQRVKTWIFPRPKGGGIVIVSYPFVFRSAH